MLPYEKQGICSVTLASALEIGNPPWAGCIGLKLSLLALNCLVGYDGGVIPVFTYSDHSMKLDGSRRDRNMVN